MSDKKRVLIIGNGVAGSQTAAILAKNPKLAVIVLTPFDFMEVSLNMTLVVASAPTGDKDKLFEQKALHELVREDGVEYTIGKCTNLSNNKATYEKADGSKGEIDFDVCVVTTGLKFPIFQIDPNIQTKEQRIQSVYDIRQQVASAQRILIEGGGAVGSELAADIKLRNPSKE